MVSEKDIRVGSDGIFIQMIAENELFVPWKVIRRTELVIEESRNVMKRKLPFGFKWIERMISKRIPLRLSAVQTLIENARMIRIMGGRIVWKNEEIRDAKRADKDISKR